MKKPETKKAKAARLKKAREKRAAAKKAAVKKAASKKKPRVKKPTSKVCCTCGKRKKVKTKTGINFWKNARNKDGLRDQCKDCFYDWRRAANEEE